MKRTRNTKNNLKTLIEGFRTVFNDATSDLASSIDRVHAAIRHAANNADILKSDYQHIAKILDAVLADMRAEDEAAKKPAE